MKKIFTLALMAIMALSANAKSWDFTKWSSTTVQQLINSADWTMDEKGNGSPYLSENECLWNVNANQWDDDGNVVAGGAAIQEMKGMQFTVLAAKGLGIGLNYPQTLDANKWGPYHGGQYLWVGKAANCTFVLKNVEPGITIKMGIESHKPSDGRGVDLDINGTALELISGQAECRPKTYEEFEWQVPDGAELVDITVKPNNGCHIYFIKCGNEEPTGETSKIGLFYYEAAGAGFEELPLYNALKSSPKLEIETIKLDAGIPAAETLQAYDAIALDGSLPADENLVAFLKENIYWQPVLNVNAELAEALGFGSKVVPAEGAESEMAVIVDNNSCWFSGFEGADDVTGEGVYGYGMTNGEAWPVPMILSGNHAKATKQLVWLDAEYAIHNDSVLGYTYNRGHNQYSYYGASSDYTEGTEVILQNIIMDAASSKSKITATKVPTFSEAYDHMQTTLTINCITPYAEIHYTTDGTEPTLTSATYTEPILFTEEATVKAIAIADGYTASNVAEINISLKPKAQAPAIAVEGDETKGYMTITLTSDEDVDIYYNFTGSEDTKNSSLYTEPIKIKNKATITAMAQGKEGVNLILSNPATQEVKANMLNIRRDTLAHFTADKSWATLSNDEAQSLVLNGEPMTAWSNGNNYYFSWGKSAAKSYEDGELLFDENGEPVMDENGNMQYEKLYRNAEVTTNVNDPDWKLLSQGQVMVHQVLGIGKAVGDGGGYNPERAEDLINNNMMTANCVQCGARVSGDIYTARIESTKKYQAPFNVLFFLGTSSGSAEKTAVQVSADGENWTTVGDTCVASATKRLFKEYEVSYDGNDEVYVRIAHIATGSGAQIYDIWVLNEGEYSKAMEQEYSTGIEEINVSDSPAKAISNIIYNIAGQAVGKDYKGLIIKNGKKYLQK